MLNNYAKSELELMVNKDEQIMWEGKPNKCCYILEGIFNPLLPFAIIWFLFDSLVFVANVGEQASSRTVSLAYVFFLFHMMPVWIYLGGILFIYRRYKHTKYIITDKGVYVSGGLFSYTCKMKPFTELARVNIHRGIIDQFMGVGDVVLTSNNVADFYGSDVRVNGRPRNIGITIASINDYRNVFDIIKKMQEDIYTDTMYPNELRPKGNKGYHTKYTGLN